jgi:hypothetical protein
MWEAGSGTLLGCGWAATNVAEHIARRIEGRSATVHAPRP